MILFGLILGVIQSVRLLYVRADLQNLVGQVRLLQNRPHALQRFATAKTWEVRAIQHFLRTCDRAPCSEISIPSGSAEIRAFPMLPSSLAREEVVQIILNFLASKFSADSAAVLSLDAWGKMQVLQLDRGQFQGAGLRATIISRFEEYFVLGKKERLRAADHTIERGVTGNLMFFGFACSYAGEILAERPMIVWLGFTSSFRMYGQGDFSETLKVVEEQLREYEVAKGLQEKYAFEKKRSEERAQLLAYAAHDMRAPIGSMRLSLSLLKDSVHRGEDLRIVSQLQTSCDLLSDIVDDAYDYSQLRAGLLRADKRDFLCADLVERVCRAFDAAAQEKRLAVVNSVPAGLSIRADWRQMTRIVSNIVGNAIKYSERGFISITCAAVDSGGVAISIKDSGIGMSDDQISRVYEPYTRFAEEQAEGLGLGLALTRAFAELNECELDIHSVPREGTTVIISVPSGMDVFSQIESREGARADTVLISDDQIEAAVSLSRILELNGFDVRVAASIRDSCAIINSFRPRYLITDLSFADGDGESLIRFARSKLEDCEIVVVSGRELYSAHHDLLDVARLTFLRKPLDVPLLLSCLKRSPSASQTATAPTSLPAGSRQVA